MRGLLVTALLLPLAQGLRGPARKEASPLDGFENSLDVNLAALGPGPRARSGRSRRVGVGVGGAAEEEYRTQQEAAKNLPKVKYECMESFAASVRFSVVCPSSCPYMRFDPTKMCHWRCVTEERCLHAKNMPPSVPNLELGMCIVCSVPGCHRCTNSTAECQTCSEGFDLVKGSCLSRTRHVWHCVYAVLLAVVALILWYILCLTFRRVQNQAVVQEAIEYRSRCKTRRWDGNHECYPVYTNLAGECTDSGGVGVLLHFRYQYVVTLWCAIAVVILGLPAATHSRLRALDALAIAPLHEEVMTACSRIGPDEEAEMEHMRIQFVWAMGFLYVITTLGAVYFAYSQRQKYIDEERHAVTMADFAVCCKGLPTDSWTHATEDHLGVEDEYLNFFKEAWGTDCVIGVSVVWNIDACGEEVQNTLDSCMHALDEASKKEAEGLATVQSDQESEPPRSQPRQSGCFQRWATLEPLDKYLWPDAESDEKQAAQHVVSQFANLQTTGTIFVVLRSERDRELAMDRELPKFRGMHELTVEHVNMEPETVLWDGFTTSSAERNGRILAGVGSIATTIALWCVCVYGPYAWYVLSWSGVAGHSQGGFWEGLLLGLIVTAGNQVVRSQCQLISESARCINRDTRDMLNTVLYTVSVLVNTIVDLWLVVVMANGWQKDNSVDTMAMVRNPGMQHALFIQLVGYIYPSTIIIPFVLEPIVSVVVPYLLFYQLVRCRAGTVNRWKAEQVMACPPFDLLRYGDITINLVLILLLFFLTSVNMWWGCLILMNSSVVIYAWDHVRFLRSSTRSFFATELMEVGGQYMTAVPCAVLASVFAFKLQGGQAMVKEWDKGSFLSYHVEWIICIAAFWVHLVLHVLALKYLIPRLLTPKRDSLQVPYEEAASKMACNWFNANPVQCLRSIHHYCHSPPHVFYVPGKEYLQKFNSQIHAYYESAEFAQESSALGDIKDLFSNELHILRQSSFRMLDKLTRSGNRKDSKTSAGDGSSSKEGPLVTSVPSEDQRGCCG